MSYLLREHLKTVHKLLSQYAPNGRTLAGFMLENGRDFRAGPDTFKGRRMKIKRCYGNCAKMATRDDSLLYCEGYIDVNGIPIEHAWLLRADGQIVDPTLRCDKDLPITDYFGVPFATEFILSSIIRNGGYCSMFDAMNNFETVADLVEGTADFKPKGK